MRAPTRLALAAALPALAAHAPAAPTEPVMTYQGRLTERGDAVSRPLYLRFRVHEHPTADAQLGSEVEQVITPDRNGRFTAELELGRFLTSDTQTWLEVAIYDPDVPGSSYVPLLPRTKITPAPVAQFALDATTPTLDAVTAGAARSEGGLVLVQGQFNSYDHALRVEWPDRDVTLATPGLRAEQDFLIDVVSGDLALDAPLGSVALSGLGAEIDAQSIDIEAQSTLNLKAPLVTINATGILSINSAGPVTMGASGLVVGQHALTQTGASIAGTLNVSGDAFKPGGGPWSTLSDARQKTNIRPIPHALDTISALRPVRFEYADPAHPRSAPGTFDGFLAQDVLPVRPDWVSADADGTLLLTPTGFEALVVGAIHELQDAHAREIDDLRRENEALRQRLEALERAVRAR